MRTAARTPRGLKFGMLPQVGYPQLWCSEGPRTPTFIKLGSPYLLFFDFVTSLPRLENCDHCENNLLVQIDMSTFFAGVFLENVQTLKNCIKLWEQSTVSAETSELVETLMSCH